MKEDTENTKVQESEDDGSTCEANEVWEEIKIELRQP